MVNAVSDLGGHSLFAVFSRSISFSCSFAADDYISNDLKRRDALLQ